MEKAELEYYWMLHEIAKALGAAENLRAILNLIVKSAVDGLGLKAASIRLLDEDGKTLRLEAAYGLSAEYLMKGPVEVGKSPIDREAMKGSPVVVKEVEKNGRMLQYPDEARREGIASMICVPLVVRDKVVGSLRGYTSKPRDFSGAEINFLTALGNLGAIAIENARVNERLIRRAEMMKRALEIAKDVTSTLDKKEILKKIVKSAAEELGARGCSLRLLDEKRGRLELVSSIGLSQSYLARGAIKVSEEIQEVLEGKAVAIHEAQSDERIKSKEALREEGIKSLLAAPITAKNKVIGVLKIYDARARRYTEEEVEFLSLLASIGGIAIENAKLCKLALTNWREAMASVLEKMDVWGAP